MKSLNSEPLSVTAGEISRNFGHWQDRALEAPVIVTHHGRPRVAVVSAGLFFGLTDDGGGGREARERSETALAAVLGAMSEAFVAFDEHLRVAAVNHPFEALAGLGAGQLAGLSCADLFPAPCQALIGEQLLRALKAGEVVEFEANASPDGARRCSMRAFPYPGGAALLLLNRSEERDLRRRFEAAEAFRTATSNLHDLGAARLNVRGAFAELDERFAAMTGFKVEELIDYRLTDVVRPAERHALSAQIESVLRTNAPAVTLATLLVKNGGERSVELSLAPVLEDYAPAGLIAAARAA
ncbi:PAS domain-containing protein [Caulobacter sp.]|uniref:PAS domain-containing protein n=1 Tax=Caulobacter sp. TaxID=78 RepID=UPI001B1D7304|nr:PAS domain-containing protein [Caulobacter sp.]MBO9545511.1 PAS domain-containing protein [Caulobacter sp.]